MSSKTYYERLLELATALFETGDYLTFSDAMEEVVREHLAEAFLAGAEDVLPPEYPEQPIITTTLQQLRDQGVVSEEDEKLPDSAKIALVALIALTIGSIPSLATFILNKRSGYNVTISSLNDALRYLNAGNSSFSVLSLGMAQQSAIGIGGDLAGSIAKISIDVQNGVQDISLAVQRSTEKAQQIIGRNILGKVDLWHSGYLNAINQGKLLSSSDETRLKWNLGQREHCQSCLKLSRKVKTAIYWREAGVGPQAGPQGSLPNLNLDCKGYKCGCFFTVTDDSLSPGDLPSLP
jgi:hypothetical protein